MISDQVMPRHPCSALWSEGSALSHATNLHEEKMASFGAATAANVTIDPVSGNDNDDYARIGDVSDSFGVTLRTLRFYEDKGLIHPKRQGVTRLYSRRDRARIKLILLGKKVGFSLREVKQMIDLYEPGGSNTAQMRAMFDKSTKQLEKMKARKG